MLKIKKTEQNPGASHTLAEFYCKSAAAFGNRLIKEPNVLISWKCPTLQFSAQETTEKSWMKVIEAIG